MAILPRVYEVSTGGMVMSNNVKVLMIVIQKEELNYINFKLKSVSAL